MLVGAGNCVGGEDGMVVAVGTVTAPGTSVPVVAGISVGATVAGTRVAAGGVIGAPAPASGAVSAAGVTTGARAGTVTITAGGGTALAGAPAAPVVLWRCA